MKDCTQCQSPLLIPRRTPNVNASPDPRLYGSEYQAYAVLTMCRALYTLQHGIVVSKPAAARWAQAALGERWAALVERALAWCNDEPFDCLDETTALVRYTLERSQQASDH